MALNSLLSDLKAFTTILGYLFFLLYFFCLNETKHLRFHFKLFPLFLQPQELQDCPSPSLARMALVFSSCLVNSCHFFLLQRWYDFIDITIIVGHSSVGVQILCSSFLKYKPWPWCNPMTLESFRQEIESLGGMLSGPKQGHKDWSANRIDEGVKTSVCSNFACNAISNS